MTVSAGFSPDLHVMDVQDTHFCYRWNHAYINEYLSVSDWQALIAPRPLVVETGRYDQTFSKHNPPFSGDKQITRRARAAYGTKSASLVHYLHSGGPPGVHAGGHDFKVGDESVATAAAPTYVTAAAVTAPIAPGDMAWQTDLPPWFSNRRSTI